jgi:HK97 family phage major capsid protein/HK97 family phage prohead protease
MHYAQRSAAAPDGALDLFVMSDGTVDRTGDVIEQAGWDIEEFRSNPIALFNHDRNQVIGTWDDVAVKGGRLVGRLKFAAEGTSALVDTVRKLVAQGILRAVSVGFQPSEKQPLNDRADKLFGPFRYTKSRLLECSLVAIPANANALAVAKDFPRDVLAEVFRKPADHGLGATAALHGTPAKSPPHQGTSKMTTGTLSARIKAAHDNLNILRDRLAEIVGIEEQTEDEARRADELPDEIAAAEATVKTLERQERALAVSVGEAKPATEVKSGELIVPDRRPFALPRTKEIEAPEYLGKALAAWFASQSTHEPLENVLRDRYKNDEKVLAVLKAAVNPAVTGTAGWASELIQTANQGFLDRLIPDFIYPTLSARGSKYTFSNSAGIIKVPTRTTTQTAAGAWVAEAAPKPVKRLSFSSITLNPYKMAVISTFSEEMAQYSTPAIEGIIREAMSNDTGVALDGFLIDAVAASAGVRPAGLLNGVTPITASVLTTATDKMIADLKALVAALVAAGSTGENIVVLVNPAQAISMNFAMTTTGDFLFDGPDGAGQRFGVTVKSSSTVAAGRVIAIDCNEFATATGDTPRFAVSNEATLHEEDTTPLAIGTTGSPATVAAPARSLFQTDSIAIRLSLYVSWAMRRTGFVQTIAAVTW